MKKLFSLLAGVMTLTVMGACTLSASAALTVSDRPEYDYYTDPPQGGRMYYKFEDDFSGQYYDFTNDYVYVFLDTASDVDMDALKAVLGEEAEDVYCYVVAENQHVFMYSPDVEYENLYDIPGVEKVQLAKYLFKGKFDSHVDYEDEIIENVLWSGVKTEPGVSLTADMFSDTGFTVQKVQYDWYLEDEDADLWSVYFEFDGMRSYTDFDKEAGKIEGVISSDIVIMCEESGSESLEFDLVAKASEGSTEPSTEPPTDAPTDLPTEADTAAPTEAPTNAPTEAPTNAPTEAPTNAPTEAPTSASADASTVSNPKTGDADTYKLVMGLAVLTAAGAGIWVRTKKEKEQAAMSASLHERSNQL